MKGLICAEVIALGARSRKTRHIHYVFGPASLAAHLKTFQWLLAKTTPAGRPHGPSFNIGESCHKYHFCRDIHFGTTNTCLSRQTKVCLSRYFFIFFCLDKHIFVATKDVFCRDKRRVLSRQKYACSLSRQILSWQVLSRQKYFVATNLILLRPNFGHDKRRALSWQTRYLWQFPPMILTGHSAASRICHALTIITWSYQAAFLTRTHSALQHLQLIHKCYRRTESSIYMYNLLLNTHTNQGHAGKITSNSELRVRPNNWVKIYSVHFRVHAHVLSTRMHLFFKHLFRNDFFPFSLQLWL